MIPSRCNRWLGGLAVALVALTLGACQTRPEVRTQSAPALDVTQYRTFGFVEHLDTDKAGYSTLITRYLKDSVTREMVARGYTQSETPDVAINFTTGEKDKVEGTTGPSLGVGYSRWGYRGFGWGLGYGGRDIRTVTEGSLTIDVVDQSRKELLWTGTASGTLTKKIQNNPQPAIDQAVTAIFAKYPKQPLVANTTPK
ncbi:MAG: DUF4136 domain-containing protein [Gammaproteobacteria bacterium]